MNKIIIIGAGIAGLTAGIYARQSGFDVTIYEAHSIPGGASTSWKRKGYLFEGGMHWLTGSSNKTALYKLWREVGALEADTPIYNRDPFHIYELDGMRVCLYRDIEKLRAHFTQLSPEDQKEINVLCNDLHKLTKLSMPITDIKGVKVKYKSKTKVSLFSMIPAFMRMSFYAKQSSGEYAMRYKSKVLQRLFMSIVGDENSATALAFTLSTLAAGDGGYPQGGSLAMANRMAKKFLSLGGDIQYNKMVDKVIVENAKAAGVIIGGNKVRADAVIITQDTRTAIDQLFDTPIHEPWADKMRKETVPMLNTFISIGIKADLSDIPESLGFTLETPIYCGGQPVRDIGINNYASYQGYAPKGCTALTSVIVNDTYDWWKQQAECGSYMAEKEKLAKAFIEMLTNKFPQIEGKIDVWDVATPLTYERYLHSYKGSWMTYMRKGAKMTRYPAKPDTISNLYFAGHRLVAPGGLPTALETGRNAIQYLCLDTDTVFQGSI